MALPLAALLAFQVYSSIEDRRKELEREGVARAEAVMLLVEERLQGQLRLASLLASATPFQNEDWPSAYRRAAGVTDLQTLARSIIVWDPVTDEEVFDLRRPYSDNRAPVSRRLAAEVEGPLARPLVGGIGPDPGGGHAMYAHVPVVSANGSRYVMTVVLDPTELQALLSQRLSPGSIGAIVDQDGRFIVRSLDPERRIGTMASVWVQQAIERGGNGLYRGKTLEGLENYTGYAVSPLSGWSVHIAVPSNVIDKSRRLSLLILLGGTALALIITVLVVMITVRDLVERGAEEDRVRQLQKMEAVGQLTGGIAHDFNNLLTAIIGGLDLALRRLPAGDRSRRHLEGALEAAKRGAKLTSQLLAFSRVQKMEIRAVDITEVLDGMGELLSQSIGPSVDFSVAVDPDARWIRTDANQLELALLNLAVNARDAMPSGGRLELRTQPLDRNGEPWVELQVKDTGMGMERAIVDRAMEPFFTTKEVGKGTGLGLSQVFGLMQQSGGDMTIDSAPGQGTIIRLLFRPAEPPKAGNGEGKRKSRQSRTLQQARILLVDDDDAVRPVLAEGLRTSGYEVVEAAHPLEAIEILRSFGPDLLIVDFLMPGMTGAELARHARRMKAGLKVLVISGHADTVELKAAVGDAPLLRKPFDAEALAAAARSALEGAAQ